MKVNGDSEEEADLGDSEEEADPMITNKTGSTVTLHKLSKFTYNCHTNFNFGLIDVSAVLETYKLMV